MTWTRNSVATVAGLFFFTTLSWPEPLMNTSVKVLILAAFANPKSSLARARSRKTTVSELVREAARERYLGKQDEQRKAMQAFVGSGKRRSAPLDTAQYVRNLRRGDRLDRLQK